MCDKTPGHGAGSYTPSMSAPEQQDEQHEEHVKAVLMDLLAPERVESGAAALARLDDWNWNNDREVPDEQRALYRERARTVLGAAISALWESDQLQADIIV
jgi:hypothetical protein